MTRHKRSSGQAYVITILFLAVLLAIAAAVLDIGSWYRADAACRRRSTRPRSPARRRCPTSRRTPRRSRRQYAAKNGGGTMNVTF